MQAIIVTGGKQYKVAQGDTLFIEKLEGRGWRRDHLRSGSGYSERGQGYLRAPTVEGASVVATVVKNGKGKKIRVFKYNPKKGYRKRQGHRQPYTKVQISAINA